MGRGSAVRPIMQKRNPLLPAGFQQVRQQPRPGRPCNAQQTHERVSGQGNIALSQVLFGGKSSLLYFNNILPILLIIHQVLQRNREMLLTISNISFLITFRFYS